MAGLNELGQKRPAMYEAEGKKYKLYDVRKYVSRVFAATGQEMLLREET